MDNIQNYGAELAGKTALVTGGTKGIGKAIADRLAQAGAKVIVVARNEVAEADPKHHFLAADLIDPTSVLKLSEQVNKQFGGIDILINNVGGLTAPGGGFSTVNDAQWEHELQLNLLSAIRLDRLLLPSILEGKNGVVIHISSVAGKQALWHLNMAYAVSKAALNAYSKALSSELASKGVRVLTVSPGATRTPNMEQIIADYAASIGVPVEEGMEKLMSQVGGIPMGRMSEPEEVASLVHFLVSPSAAYLTGANYLIDGGALPVV
jgi:NAD(P)-dependent dehydrogenase (short-subunit alcohol dehydrogenase family)